MPNAFTTAQQVAPQTREQWRAWLAGHHDQPAGVWVVSWRRHTGKPAMTYEEQILEAVAFGWVDSTAKTLDPDRSMLYFAPRRRGSGWARSNKERVTALEAAGLLAEPGRRAVEAAKADGSWTMLDDVEALVVPPDLAGAFDRHPGSRERWDASTVSSRRQALGWIAQAKRATTRAQRVEHVAAATARGEGPR